MAGALGPLSRRQISRIVGGKCECSKGFGESPGDDAQRIVKRGSTALFPNPQRSADRNRTVEGCFSVGYIRIRRGVGAPA